MASDSFDSGLIEYVDKLDTAIRVWRPTIKPNTPAFAVYTEAMQVIAYCEGLKKLANSKLTKANPVYDKKVKPQRTILKKVNPKDFKSISKKEWLSLVAGDYLYSVRWGGSVITQRQILTVRNGVVELKSLKKQNDTVLYALGDRGLFKILKDNQDKAI